jgi:hypothetical protein
MSQRFFIVFPSRQLSTAQQKVPEVASGLGHRSASSEPRADKLAELPGQAELHAKQSRSRSVDQMTYQRRTLYQLMTVARALGIYLAKAL